MAEAEPKTALVISLQDQQVEELLLGQGTDELPVQVAASDDLQPQSQQEPAPSTKKRLTDAVRRRYRGALAIAANPGTLEEGEAAKNIVAKLEADYPGLKGIPAVDPAAAPVPQHSNAPAEAWRPASYTSPPPRPPPDVAPVQERRDDWHFHDKDVRHNSAFGTRAKSPFQPRNTWKR